LIKVFFKYQVAFEMGGGGGGGGGGGMIQSPLFALSFLIL